MVDMVKKAAKNLFSAYDAGTQMAPLSEAGPLNSNNAYEISAHIAAARRARGEHPVGRKIGFTNRSIWEKYGVDAPMWSWIYDTTYHEIGADGAIRLPRQSEPRLEPEIAFGFGQTPEIGMSVEEIAECIDWVAHSIEIVASPYPAWRFTIADCIAAQALHAAFWCGEKVPASDVFKGGVKVMEGFSCHLTGPEETREGHATDVLGGPLHAMQFLLKEIARMPGADDIQPGEVVTTGTLTDGHPIATGEEWLSDLTGINLPRLSVRLID